MYHHRLRCREYEDYKASDGCQAPFPRPLPLNQVHPPNAIAITTPYNPRFTAPQWLQDCAARSQRACRVHWIVAPSFTVPRAQSGDEPCPRAPTLIAASRSPTPLDRSLELKTLSQHRLPEHSPRPPLSLQRACRRGSRSCMPPSRK